MDSAGLPQRMSLNYAAALDPWLRRSHTDTEHLIKLGALTSRHLVISDNQLINNQGLHRLLMRDDVEDFLFSPDSDGMAPVVVSLRQGAKSFEDVIAELVTNRERPAILPWLTSRQQERLDHIYGDGGETALGPLYDIAGPTFAAYVETLNRFIDLGPSSTTPWSGLQSSYVLLVLQAIDGLRQAMMNQDHYGTSQLDTLKLLDRLVEYIQKGIATNRSNLYRVIADAPISLDAQQTVALKTLYEPYHRNFAEAGGFNALTGPEYQSTRIGAVFPDSSMAASRLDLIDVIEMDALPLSLSQVPFSRIQQIRNTASFGPLIRRIESASDSDRPYEIRDLLSLINGELSREPRGVQRLRKLRINVVSTPDSLQDELAAAGIAFSDLLGLISRGSGFVTGELIGWAVGVIGVGGLAGAAVGTYVEHVIDSRVTTPSRRRELDQVVQQLLPSSPD